MSFISNIKHKRARAQAKKDADRAGAFWLPCTLCEEPFSGIELQQMADCGLSQFVDHQDYPGYGQGICPTCTLAGKGDPKFLPVALDGE